MRQRQRLDRLGVQLEAIAEALDTARAEPVPELRERWLDLVGRAVDAARLEHEAAIEEGTRLRLLPGGSGVVVGLTAAGVWVREAWGAHRPLTVGAVVAAGLVVAVLLFGTWEDDSQISTPATVPTVTATVTVTSSPSSSATGSEAPPSSVSSPRPAVTAVAPTGEEDEALAEGDSPGRGTGSAIPPGLGDRTSTARPPQDGSAPPGRGTPRPRHSGLLCLAVSARPLLDLDACLLGDR